MFSSATQPLPPPSPPPPRHNFVVSAITFEEFKLHSSNFTHALLIQISRTSCVKLCIDLKWQEMRSKVIFGHKKWPTAAGLSKKVFFGHPKWPIELFSNIQYVRRWPFCKHFFLNFRIYLKWPEMRSKVNFGHPKWPTAVILSKNSQKQVAYRSKMARNAIESEFRTSKKKLSCISI